MTRARELASTLMENSSASLRATKKLLTDHARDGIDAQIEEAVRRMRHPQDRRFPRRHLVVSWKSGNRCGRENEQQSTIMR